jgi:hypothetical protein
MKSLKGNFASILLIVSLVITVVMAIPFQNLKQAVSVDRDEQTCTDDKWNASVNDFLWNKTIGLIGNRTRSH